MDSREVQSIALESLDRFRVELAEAGFDSNDGGRTWVGPIAGPLTAFTNADRMEVAIRDGWPFAQPQLKVDDMRNLHHVNAAGTICLWADGDASREWMSFSGIERRIEEWCEAQHKGFPTEDATMDAHAYFEDRLPNLALMNLSTIGTPDDGASGAAYGKWRQDKQILDINAKQSSGCRVKGHWFYREKIDAPPKDLTAFRNLLTPTQREQLESSYKLASRNKHTERLAILIWDDGGVKNVLTILFRRSASGETQGKIKAANPTDVVTAHAIEFASNDDTTLRRRAGIDAAWLENYRAIVFGVGAVGSHAALLLAECGIGGLTLVDGERIRPGNVVRHAASVVGEMKANATKKLIANHTLRTTVETVASKTWSPPELRKLIGDHDVILDATGHGGFSDQLAYLADDDDELLVTAILYRQGNVARICRQGPGDTRLWERDDAERYPTIPRGPDAPPQLEAGCSASVNNASPRSVVACAALAADVVIDALTGSPQLPDEIVDIYRPLEKAPFDNVGRLTSA